MQLTQLKVKDKKRRRRQQALYPRMYLRVFQQQLEACRSIRNNRHLVPTDFPDSNHLRGCYICQGELL